MRQPPARRHHVKKGRGRCGGACTSGQIAPAVGDFANLCRALALFGFVQVLVGSFPVLSLLPRLGALVDLRTRRLRDAYQTCTPLQLPVFPSPA